MLSYYGGTEYFGFFENPHLMGLALCALSVLHLQNLLRRYHLATGVLLLANLSWIWLLQVRTYQLTVAVAMIMLLLSHLQKRTNGATRLLMGMLGSVAALSVLFWVLLTPSVLAWGTRFLQVEPTQVHALSSGRTVFWQALLRDYLSSSDLRYFFLGNGIGHAQAVLIKTLHWPIGAHNDWIQFLLEGGLTGFLFLLTLAGWSFVRFWRHMPHGSALAMGLVWLIPSVLNGTVYYTLSMCLYLMVAWSLMNGHTDRCGAARSGA